MMHRITAAALALGLTTLLAATAWAEDFDGTGGKLVALEHIDDSSDNYTAYRGILWLSVGSGVLQKYYWGGTLCAGRDLDVAQQQLLTVAFSHKKGVVIPYWKAGQAGVRCLVRFTIVPSAKIAAAL